MPNEKGLTDEAVAGSIVEPAAAKLHPFLKLGAPIASKYEFKNGKSKASTAKMSLFRIQYRINV